MHVECIRDQGLICVTMHFEQLRRIFTVIGPNLSKQIDFIDSIRLPNGLTNSLKITNFIRMLTKLTKTGILRCQNVEMQNVQKTECSVRLKMKRTNGRKVKFQIKLQNQIRSESGYRTFIRKWSPLSELYCHKIVSFQLDILKTDYKICFRTRLTNLGVMKVLGNRKIYSLKTHYLFVNYLLNVFF